MFKRVFSILSVVLFLSFALPAFAQDDEDPRIPLIQELLEVLNYKASIQAVEAQLPEQIRANLEAAGSELTEQQIQVVEEVALEEIAILKKQALAFTINLYLQFFSEQELRDILEFYKTDSGRSMAKKMPELTVAISQEMNRLLIDMNPRLTAKLVERLQALDAPDTQDH